MLTVFGKQVPANLSELVNPASTALVIIDMQNDCCAEGGSAAKAGADISMYRVVIPRIVAFAQTCRAIRIPVINVRILTLRDGLSDSPAWLRLRVRANQNYGALNEGPWMFAVEQTWGAEFVPSLRPKQGDLTVTKYRSSAFHQTNLDLILRSNGVSTIIVCGCTTEGCVESTVRDATFYDYFPVVLEDCVGSDDRSLHDASLRVMKAYRADVCNSADVLQLWQAAFSQVMEEG